MNTDPNKPESNKTKQLLVTIAVFLLTVILISLTYNNIKGCINLNASQTTNSTSSSATANQSSEGSANTSSEAANTAELEILESGYFITRNGNVNYGIVWQNSSDTSAIYAPTLLIVGKSISGEELFTETNKRPVKIYPHEKQVFAGSVSKNTTQLHSVEFKVANDSSLYSAAQAQDSALFTLSNQQEKESDAYSKLYTCQLTASRIPSSSSGYIFYDVILRDEQGKIVFGDSATNVSAGSGASLKTPNEGETIECSFKVGTPDLFGGVPEHASFEIAATAGCNP